MNAGEIIIGDGSPKNIEYTESESELFADEAEKLIAEIHAITERMGGIGKLPIKKKEKVEKWKELYEERKKKILRVEEIAKLSIEKGYIEG